MYIMGFRGTYGFIFEEGHKDSWQEMDYQEDVLLAVL